MGNMQRSKGSTGERELAGLIHDELGVCVIRRLDQSRSGGHDLAVAPGQSGPAAEALQRYAIEVKRHARVTPGLLAKWWEQACLQASEAGLVPALAYRTDRAAWRVVMPLLELHPDITLAPGVDFTADLSLPGFCAIVRERAE
jgi:Holliday junction resolvase